jgi:hypothetical protein
MSCLRKNKIKRIELQFLTLATTKQDPVESVAKLNAMFEKAKTRGELNEIWQATADGGNLPLHIASKLGNACVVEWIFNTWDANG